VYSFVVETIGYSLNKLLGYIMEEKKHRKELSYLRDENTRLRSKLEEMYTSDCSCWKCVCDLYLDACNCKHLKINRKISNSLNIDKLLNNL